MKFAKVTIDGVDYTLAYDFNKLCEAEELCNCSLLAVLDNPANITASQIRGVLYAALEAGPERTWPGKKPHEALEAAGALIRPDTFGAITRAIVEAYRLAYSEPDKPVPAAE